MADFLSEIRNEMVENFQISLRAIRRLMGYSATELAEYVGVTRQTINNLETGKVKMSASQFLALAAVVDRYIASNGEMFQAIRAIMDSNYRKTGRSYDASFSGFSLLKRWFSSFDSVPDAESEDSDALMKQLAGNYKIFLDADVLLTDSAETFIDALMKRLSSEHADVIVPLRTVERLQELTQSPELSQKAIRGLRFISLLQRNAMAQIRGEEGDASLHETILSVFAKFRAAHRLCALTQDRAFANEILSLNHTPDAGGFHILAGYVNEAGEIVLYPDFPRDSADGPEEELSGGFPESDAELSGGFPEPELNFLAAHGEPSDETDGDGDATDMRGWGML